MKITEKNLGKYLSLLGFLGVVLVAFFSVNTSIWSDETNSLINITYSHGEIFKNARYDCHPPLYHLMLKTFIELTAVLGINRIYVAKIFSVIPFFIIYLFVVIKSRKKENGLISGTFLLCLCGMPNLMTYAIQIRMYSWAMLFVFLTFAYAYEILTQENIKSTVFFVLFSILASFTHYYACVSVAFIYLYIFIYMFFAQRKRFIRFLVAALVIVVAFLPWLLSIVDTIKGVLGGFWIKPVTVTSLIGYIWFVLFPNIYKYHLSGILGVIISIVFLGVICHYVRHKEKKVIDKIYIVMGVGCTAGTLLFGILASLVLGPVYQDRFIYPSLAVLWLAFSVCVNSIDSNKIRNGIYILILLFCVINVTDVVTKERAYKDNFQEFQTVFDGGDVEKSVIVSDSYHISCCMSFYFEEADKNVPVYLWNNEADGMYIKVPFYKNLDNLEDVQVIEEYVNLGYDVLFMENIGYNSDFVSKCQAQNMIPEELGEYGVEDREFILYRIKGE